MASLIPSANTKGRVLRRVEFDSLHGGRRERVRLGRVTIEEGLDFKRRIETILADLLLGQQHTANLCEWLNGLPAGMQERLQRAGLIQAARKSGTVLGGFLDGLRETATVKASTATTYENVFWNLTQFFGRGRLI